MSTAYPQQDTASPLWLIFIAAVFVVLELDPTSTMRVQEYECPSGEVEDGGQCKAGARATYRYKFTLNRQTKSVAMIVLEAPKDRIEFSVILDNCQVVDLDNWTCDRGFDRITMVDGYYRRDRPSPGAQAYRGAIGWRHWLAYAGFHRFQPKWRL